MVSFNHNEGSCINEKKKSNNYKTGKGSNRKAE